MEKYIVPLTIVTVNKNNAGGLEKTLQSIESQTFKQFEHIIIDGASTDRSVEVIENYASRVKDSGMLLRWSSEPDSGIYNAMNKALRKAGGEYIQIVNSGDCLIAPSVTASVMTALKEAAYPSILYGNMIKQLPGRRLRDRCFCGQEITLLGMYKGTLNHSPAYIKRCLFDKYGYYDESLSIVSDWKWYFQAIILGAEKPVYSDLDITLFDMGGISETNLMQREKERSETLRELLPRPVLLDYERFAFCMEQMKRLQRHPWAYKMVWVLERLLFKFEKYTAKEQCYK